MRIQRILCGLALLTVGSGLGCVAQTQQKINEVSFTDVHLTDQFWQPRLETNRTVSIPSAFHECEVNGRFDNFAIAGGLKQGEHRGDFRSTTPTPTR